MTRKLYYEDCHLAAFSARVIRCEETDRGYEITLDQTAFYPEGGGQPCDLGTIGGVQVLDVRERGEAVIHLCDGAQEVGREVSCVIDYERRFDLMQQHSGEHMVSGVIHRKYGYHNVGFHMGRDLITIDFDGPIAPEDLPAIEAEVNRAIWQDLPLRIWYPGPEELPRIPYRSKRELPWPVRIVEVPGMDICACCGVHVERTGEIGLVKLFSMTKFHDGVRMEMACGGRALELLSKVYDENRRVSQTFSAKILETGAAARQFSEALTAEKFTNTGLWRRLFAITAEGYRGAGNVLHFETDLEPGLVRELADRIATDCGGRAAVFSGSDETGYGFCLATREGDLRQMCKAMTQALKGRGGGKPNFQQGRVNATEDEIRQFLNH